MKRLTLLLICSLVVTLVAAQTPVIQKIEPVSGSPKKRIVITGSGFNSNAAQMQVWFEQVQGTITAASDFSLEVEVPAQARLSTVTVVNLSSRQSAKSNLKFMPVFSGEPFSASKFTAPLAFTSTNAVFDLIAGDLDGDNKPDFVGSKFENTATNLFFLLNQSTVGNLAFTNPTLASLAINAPTGHLALGDLNADGKLDLVASRSGTTANSVFVLRNTSTVGTPGFAAPLVLTMDVSHFARQVAIHDLNNDGKPEIIVANSTTPDLYIYRNESSGGTLTINPTPTKIPVTGALNTLAIEILDVDGDGKADIAATQNQSNDVFILKNTSTGAFSFAITKLTMFGTLNDLASADFNKDGKMDLVATSVFGAQVLVLINQSTNTTVSFQAPILLPADSGPFGLDVTDFNGDGFADFVVGNRGIATASVFLHTGSLAPVAFTKVNLATSKSNWFLRAGDLDGDAKPDLAVSTFANPSTFSVDILRNQHCHVPVIQNAAPLFICPTQTIQLTTLPMPGITYDWKQDGVSFKTSADPFADITAAGSYTVTATGEAGACAITSNALVVQSGAGTLPADPTITTNSPVCEGQTLTLTTGAVAGATYLWTGPNNFTAATQNVSIPNAASIHAGLYTLVVKVGDCSSNVVSEQVDVATFGTFSVTSNSATNSVCQGQSVTLSVNTQPGYSLQWVKDGTDVAGQTAATLNVTQEGTYKVRVTNLALSCSRETNSIAVTFLTPPVATFTVAATACVDTAVSFTNTSTTDTRATVVYAWTFGDTNTSAQQSPTHTYTTVQNFNAQLTVSYSGITGCTNSLSKSINVVAPVEPTLVATRPALCAGETSTLTAEGTFTSYLWSTNETTASIEVSSPNDYSVTTTDANGCTASASITIAANTDCPVVITELVFPEFFTPNGDTQNDRWVILNIENYGDCTMNIFDGRGRKVFEKTGYPVEGWDGTFDGKEVPVGTYYYVLSCPNENPTTGSMLIIR